MTANPWDDWLNGVPPEQLASLMQALVGRIPAPATNGEIKHQAEQKNIPIICTPPNELIIPPGAPFVDVFNLMHEYSKLAFTDHGNLLLKGPKGNGKSISFRAFAAQFGIPMVVVECSENTKDLQLIGRYVMVGRETHFVLNGLPKAIKTANEVGYCILLLEEFNALTPQSQKLLNGVLQEKAVEVDALGRTFRLVPGAKVWFVGTMNPSVYGGTYDINEDLKSRMGEIEIDYPPNELEKQIVKANLTYAQATVDEGMIDLVLLFAKESRQQAMGYSMSTRDVVRTLLTIHTNGLKTALQMIICKYEGEDRKTALARLNSVFKGAQVNSTWTGK
jgi:MoxR-like ATPase